MEWVPSPLATVAAWLLTATFGWAVVAKSFDRVAWTSAVTGFGFRGRLAYALVFAVPLAEVAVVGLFLVGSVKAGAALTLALVASFSIAIVRVRATSQRDKVPCGCFGGTKSADYRLLLGRNAGLACLSAVILLAPRSTSLSLPEGTEIVPTALVVVAAVLLVWMTSQAATSLRRR